MKDPTTTIDIDRISLRLSGIKRHQAGPLAQLIKEGLLNQAEKIGPFTRSRSRDLGNITLNLKWNSQQPLSVLANQVVMQLFERVNQSVRTKE